MGSCRIPNLTEMSLPNPSIINKVSFLDFECKYNYSHFLMKWENYNTNEHGKACCRRLAWRKKSLPNTPNTQIIKLSLL